MPVKPRFRGEPNLSPFNVSRGGVGGYPLTSLGNVANIIEHSPHEVRAGKTFGERETRYQTKESVPVLGRNNIIEYHYRGVAQFGLHKAAAMKARRIEKQAGRRTDLHRQNLR